MILYDFKHRVDSCFNKNLKVNGFTSFRKKGYKSLSVSIQQFLSSKMGNVAL